MSSIHSVQKCVSACIRVLHCAAFSHTHDGLAVVRAAARLYPSSSLRSSDLSDSFFSKLFAMSASTVLSRPRPWSAVVEVLMAWVPMCQWARMYQESQAGNTCSCGECCRAFGHSLAAYGCFCICYSLVLVATNSRDTNTAATLTSREARSNSLRSRVASTSPRYTALRFTNRT